MNQQDNRGTNLEDTLQDGGFAGTSFNHNETMPIEAITNDEEAETESLEDLSVESDEQIVGGRMLNIKNPELTR